MAEQTADSMVARVVRVIDAFALGEPFLSASDIARRADLPVATAHRIVAELVSVGLLQREADRRVGIGLKLWEIATRAHQVSMLRRRALPFMEDLQFVVNQHTQLAILDRENAFYVEALTSRRATIPNVIPPGMRLPVLSCATGLSLAAFSPPEVRDQLLEAPITKFTERTVVDRDALRRILGEIHSRQYAITKGWIDVRTSGIAVPLLSSDGTVYAALSLVLPVEEADHPGHLAALRTAANGIMRSMRPDEDQADIDSTIVAQSLKRATRAR